MAAKRSFEIAAIVFLVFAGLSWAFVKDPYAVAVSAMPVARQGSHPRYVTRDGLSIIGVSTSQALGNQMGLRFNSAPLHDVSVNGTAVPVMWIRNETSKATLAMFGLQVVFANCTAIQYYRDPTCTEGSGTDRTSALTSARFGGTTAFVGQIIEKPTCSSNGSPWVTTTTTGFTLSGSGTAASFGVSLFNRTVQILPGHSWLLALTCASGTISVRTSIWQF